MDIIDCLIYLGVMVVIWEVCTNLSFLVHHKVLQDVLQTVSSENLD